jgi:hypothetical protein
MTDAYGECDIDMKGFLGGRMRIWSYTAILNAECQVKVGLFFLVNLWQGHDAVHNGLVSSCLGISGKKRYSNVDPDRAEHVDSPHPMKNGQVRVASYLRGGSRRQTYAMATEAGIPMTGTLIADRSGERPC